MTTIADLKPDPKNARRHPERNMRVIMDSLQEVGAARSIVIDENNVILAGNGLVEAAGQVGIENVKIVEVDGETIVAVKRTGLSAKEKKRLAILDNRAGELAEWEPDVLAELNIDGLLGGLFYENELELLLQQAEGALTALDGADARQTLAERFGIPPFSVLDARQGYWQERKRAWIALGIQSELGRGEGVHQYSEGATASLDGGSLGHDGSKVYAARNAAPGGSLRPATTLKDGKTQRGDGTGKPIRNGALAVSDTIHELKPSADQGRKRALARTEGSGSPGDLRESFINEGATRRGNLWHGGNAETTRQIAETASGTSIFDPVLCEVAYRWFCPESGIVLDPFAGGSVRGIVAAKLGRQYLGIDLRPEQIAANEDQSEEICDTIRPAWKVGNSEQIKEIAAGEYDFIFSCPPYADLEVYSDNPADLSTMPYDAFLRAYRGIVGQCVGMLKENRFACFVVGDIRDKKGFYRGFVSDTICAFEDAGAKLYNEAILITAVGSLPIRVGKQFGSYRKLGKTHQNVLVFYKGDPKKIPGEFGSCEFSEVSPDTASESVSDWGTSPSDTLPEG